MVARCNHLVRMRIAQALSDGEWHSVDYIKDRFITNGWSFLNGPQLAQLCRGTVGIEKRHLRNRDPEFRLVRPAQFYQWMQT